MKSWQIMVVDDEPLNLEIIREILDDPRYVLEMVTSADAAWQILQQEDRDFDLALLDWMMPGMSGIDLLRRIKDVERFRAMPVIMQTAARSPENIQQGIAAGAYYYLTKPYDLDALGIIVRAALLDLEEQREALGTLQQPDIQAPAIDLVDSATFHFATMEEAHRLAALLAKLCPAPETVVLGFTELLINAVEHGNLGIGYAEKSELRRAGLWEEEIIRRQSLPEYHDRQGRVTVERREGMLEFTIVDAGAGFDWRRYLDFEPERSSDPNGRGIAMARALSLASLEYRGKGNVVAARVALEP